MYKTAFITGGAQRIGAAVAQTLHAQGYDIFLHYGQSELAAQSLQNSLNKIRPHSCEIIQGDLNDANFAEKMTTWFEKFKRPLNVLINNASQFYPTPWQQATEEQWLQLFNCNAKAPFFLTQAFLPYLKQQHGHVINLIDIHAERTLEEHPIYSASKAALKSLTLSLAKDHGHEIRCNGISPGAILWPTQDAQKTAEQKKSDDAAQQAILNKIPMGRLGDVQNIADTVLFLCNNNYINGQIINVDGGRTVHS